MLVSCTSGTFVVPISVATKWNGSLQLCLYNAVFVVFVVILAFIVIIGRDGGDRPQLIRVDQDHGKGHVQFPNREYEKCHEDHVPERQGHGAQYEQFWQ